jgi:hypothetical protein
VIGNFLLRLHLGFKNHVFVCFIAHNRHRALKNVLREMLKTLDSSFSRLKRLLSGSFS